MGDLLPHQAAGTDRTHRTSDNDYRLLLHSSPLAMFVVDPHAARVMDANQAFANLIGYSHDELLRMDSRFLAHPESGGRREADLRALEEGVTDPQTSVRQLIRKDGTAIWVKAHISAIHRDGQFLAMVCLEDWTEAHWHSEDLPADQ